MTRNSLILGAACIALVSIAAGDTARAADPKTLRTGELAVQLARAAGLALPAQDAERVAAERLARLGIDLGSSLSRPVVERDLVLVGQALGLPVASAQPANTVSPGQGSAFVGVVRGSLLAAEEAGNGNGNGGTKEGGINASCQGRDARSGRNGEPASPSDPNATAPPCGEEPAPEPQPEPLP